MEERARGRRPVGGELPVCGKTAICKAQRVRTMGACRNCAVYSLRNAVAPKKNRLDDLLAQSPGCKDLYTRLSANKSDQESWLIDIYVHLAGGSVADVYAGKKPEPKHDDLLHAKQLFNAVGLTCLRFNNMSPSHASFRFIEDLLFCKRHKPLLTSWGLKKMCQAVYRACEPDHKNTQTMERIHDVKNAIIAQSAVMNSTDNSLKQQFNDWCTNFFKIDYTTNQPLNKQALQETTQIKQPCTSSVPLGNQHNPSLTPNQHYTISTTPNQGASSSTPNQSASSSTPNQHYTISATPNQGASSSTPNQHAPISATQNQVSQSSIKPANNKLSKRCCPTTNTRPSKRSLILRA